MYLGSTCDQSHISTYKSYIQILMNLDFNRIFCSFAATVKKEFSKYKSIKSYLGT